MSVHHVWLLKVNPLGVLSIAFAYVGDRLDLTGLILLANQNLVAIV